MFRNQVLQDIRRARQGGRLRFTFKDNPPYGGFEAIRRALISSPFEYEDHDDERLRRAHETGSLCDNGTLEVRVREDFHRSMSISNTLISALKEVTHLDSP